MAPGMSGRDIEKAVNGQAKVIRKALQVLVTEGYVQLDPDADPRRRGFSYVNLKAFRESSDPHLVVPGEDDENHDDDPMEDF